MDTTTRNLWSAFIGEAKANRMYVAYGIKALEEGHPEVAQIFFEVSGAETIHAIQHLRTVGAVKSTVENLRQVVEEEQYEGQDMYPRFIEQAKRDGRAEAVRAFELAMSREHHHLKLFQETLDELKQKLNLSDTLEAPAPSAASEPQPKPALPVFPRKSGEVANEKSRIVRLERIRDIVFGMQDGLVSTMTVAASVMTATGKTAPTLAAAFATGAAGMISMAGGNLLGSRAEKELHESEIRKEAKEIAEKPEEEMAELIEVYLSEGFSREQAEKMALKVASDAQLWLKTMAEKELGLSLESLMERNPWKDAAIMGGSFFAGAVFSALPYAFMPPSAAISGSIAFSLTVLFLIGVAKGRMTKANPWRSGFEVLAIGAVGAAAGYCLGRLAPGSGG